MTELTSKLIHTSRRWGVKSIMRPLVLIPYFAAVNKIKGVGPRVEANLARLGIRRVRDLLFHMPASVIDRRARPKLADIKPGDRVTVRVMVGKHSVPPRGRRAPYRVVVFDDSAEMTLAFFNARGDYLARQLPEGETRIISGSVDDFGGALQMTHPDYMVSPDDEAEIPPVEPVYPLTAGVSLKLMGKSIRTALDSADALPEWQDAAFHKREGFTDFQTALKAVHRPASPEEALPDAPARKRLAYDELLAHQLALALVRRSTRMRAGRSLIGSGDKRAAIVKALPYALTGDQQQALDETIKDMAAARGMLRLVQGDVGSGKTVVAALAMAAAVEAGVQAALLAPTEILANQHAASISALVEPAGLRVALLTGRVKGKARQALLEALAAGEIDILIGTHAIIQEAVVFRDLGLAVIDEQHRFGVAQRLALAEKAPVGIDMLGMTATPIPRTLTLALYGDMDTSRIVEKPPGRQPITTRVVSNERLGEVAAGIRRQLDAGAQVYWVCPLVEESEDSDQAAAEARFDDLSRLLGGDAVGLVHGKMKGAEKDAVMARFKAAEIKLLVATTVIEVGVDVPNATIMVIEGADRFGLAQLHQLRGRVGRGAKASSCLLVRNPNISEVASKRLEVMRDSEDGFFIAEEDLKLRGAGEVLGTRQSGLPNYHFADFVVHGDLVAAARDDARLIADQDPELAGKRGEALRTLLYLFERDAAVRTLKSG